MAAENEWEDIPAAGEWEDVGVPLQKYGEMPWSEVASKGISALPSSAKKSVMAIPEALWNYPETFQGIKQLGRGVASKLDLLGQMSPEERAKEEAVVNAMMEPFTSTAGFKKALAEDPFSVLTAAALPLSGVGGALIKGSEAAGRIGQVAGLAGKAMKGASYVADPTRGIVSAAKVVPGVVSGAAKKSISATTGVPEFSFEQATKAGASVDPAIKNAFNAFAAGEGDADRFSSSVRKAVKDIKDEEHSGWISEKERMTGLPFRPDLGFEKIEEAIRAAREHIGDPEFGIGTEEAHKALDHVESMIKKRMEKESGHPAKSLKGADELKRQLWEYSVAHPEARTPVRMVHASVKDAINDIAPDYQSLMDKWQDIGDTMNNIVKSLGAGDKVAANAELKKFIAAQKTPEGRSLINRIAEKDPLIPYMVAGATLHGAGALGKAGLAEALTVPYHIYQIGRSLASGDIPEMMGHTATAAGQIIAQSPRAMGTSAYGAGTVAGASERAAGRVPTATSPAAKAAKKFLTTTLEFAPEARSVLTPLRRAEEETGIRSEEAFGGRIHRATGGGVRALTAQQLISMADAAKKSINSRTKEILKAPDEHVVRALDVANRHI